MDDECRFGSAGYCITHARVDPISGEYPKGANPALCTHAAAALRAHVADLATRVRELEGRKEELVEALTEQTNDSIQLETRLSRAEARVQDLDMSVEELLGFAGIDKERIARAEATVERLLEALTEIAKGKGAFSLDPLEHCANTVESMKEIARTALSPQEPPPSA